jgi:putative phosphoesterase
MHDETTRAARESADPPTHVTARIAVISDTHGILPQCVLDACADADHIIHAGDVGAREVLDRLARLAPVSVVRGNRDRDDFGLTLPEEAEGTVAGLRFVVGHKRRYLKARHPDPLAEGFRLLVYGDSHRAEIRFRGHEPGGVPVL